MNNELENIVKNIAFQLFRDKKLTMVNANSLHAKDVAVWLYEKGFIIQRASEYDILIYTNNLRALLSKDNNICLFCNDIEVIV